MKLRNMRFEKIQICEGVATCKKVITKDYYLLLKIFGERALVNNFLECFYTAKIHFYYILTNLR